MYSPLQVKIWFQNRRMKWRNTKERELLASGGGNRDSTIPHKDNPNPDLTDVKCDTDRQKMTAGSTKENTQCSGTQLSEAATEYISSSDSAVNETNSMRTNNSPSDSPEINKVEGFLRFCQRYEKNSNDMEGKVSVMATDTGNTSVLDNDN